jgi:hypothetical protein
LIQDQEVVRVTDGQVEIVQGGYHRGSVSSDTVNPVKGVDLVSEIEVGSRFVQQKCLRLLCQGECQKGALPFAAGEGVHKPMLELACGRKLERVRHSLRIRRGPSGKAAAVRNPAAADKLLHREVKPEKRILLQSRNSAGDIPDGVATDVYIIQSNRAARQRNISGQGSEQGRFAGAVRPEQNR